MGRGGITLKMLNSIRRKARSFGSKTKICREVVRRQSFVDLVLTFCIPYEEKQWQMRDYLVKNRILFYVDGKDLVVNIDSPENYFFHN